MTIVECPRCGTVITVDSTATDVTVGCPTCETLLSATIAEMAAICVASFLLPILGIGCATYYLASGRGASAVVCLVTMVVGLYCWLMLLAP